MPALRRRVHAVDWPYHGGTALVTGASSGIGAAIARALAARQMALALVALPSEEAELRALARELAASDGIRAEAIALDLTSPEAPLQLRERADVAGLDPDLLVSCAGVGLFGEFTALPLERQMSMVRLNVEASVALTRLYLPRLVERRHGAVLLVASTAAFQPMPYHAVYAASKAFLLRLGEALWAENHQHGVRIVTVCPGPVAGTRFAPYAYVETPPFPTIPVADVVRAALDGVACDKPVVTCRTRGGSAVYLVSQATSHLLPQRRRLALLERAFRLRPLPPGGQAARQPATDGGNERP